MESFDLQTVGKCIGNAVFRLKDHSKSPNFPPAAGQIPVFPRIPMLFFQSSACVLRTPPHPPTHPHPPPPSKIAAADYAEFSRMLQGILGCVLYFFRIQIDVECESNNTKIQKMLIERVEEWAPIITSTCFFSRIFFAWFTASSCNFCW